MYRPWRPHTNPSLITPGQPILYEIEIFPVGHVFRAGHKIEVKIMAPPAVDSYYAYILKTPRGLNTVIHDPAYAGCPAGGCMSSIVFPEVPTPPLGSPVGCGEQEAVRCVPNPNG